MAERSDLVLYLPDFRSVRLIECSPSSWMVQLALLEKRLDHELVWLSFADGEHQSPEMLRRNPRGTIPVLGHGAVHLHEALGMLQYLEVVYPEPTLLPREPQERGLALHRLHTASQLRTLGSALFACLMQTHEADQDPVMVNELSTPFSKELDSWERLIRALTPGERPEPAELVLFTYLATAVHLGFSLEVRPALADFYERMCQRSSVQLSWPEAWRLGNHAVLA